MNNSPVATLTASRQSPIVLESDLQACPNPDYLKICWSQRIIAHRRDAHGHATHFDILNPPLDSPLNFLVLAGHRYDLAQLHFHAPSEHVVRGRRALGELHLVHVSPDDGRYAVIGVLIEHKAGAHSCSLDARQVKALCNCEKDEPVEFEPHGLLPEKLDFFRYQGALTTPPYHETVSWVVFEQPIAVDDPDLEAFASRVDGRVRPTQPRDRRIVIRCHPPTITQPE